MVGKCGDLEADGRGLSVIPKCAGRSWGNCRLPCNLAAIGAMYLHLQIGTATPPAHLSSCVGSCCQGECVAIGKLHKWDGAVPDWTAREILAMVIG
jgi:hypothetical protein